MRNRVGFAILYPSEVRAKIDEGLADLDDGNYFDYTDETSRRA
jgi:hypothetical protein